VIAVEIASPTWSARPLGKRGALGRGGARAGVGPSAGESHPGKAKAKSTPVPPALDAGAISGKGVVGSIGGTEVFLGSPNATQERIRLSSDESAAIESLNAQGKTVSVLVAGSKVAGLIALRDEPRADARRAIAWFRGDDIRTLMLTGDNRRTAAAIAENIGGMEARAELLPEDKQKMKIVRELQREGFTVAKIGDGINDAPGLAAADIGVAMGGGTDVTLETADAASLHRRVMDVADMMSLSRATMGNIGQNIAVALGLKALFS
jgi:Cd2+/Zn2+-exporting ATPase